MLLFDVAVVVVVVVVVEVVIDCEGGDTVRENAQDAEFLSLSSSAAVTFELNQKRRLFGTDFATSQGSLKNHSFSPNEEKKSCLGWA